MIRFAFELRPLAEVGPWGGDRPVLHWFALTEGWYRIEVGGHELLRYADATVARWPEPERTRPYVDYYVVRLWEDLLTALPAILEPVPADLVPLLESGPADRLPIEHWPEPDDEFAAAAGWRGDRVLPTHYLRVAPEITFWRTVTGDRDEVTVQWRNPVDAEISYAGPETGRIAVPTSAFVAAVRDLDGHLCSAMADRIAELERTGPPPGVALDLAGLRREHEDRATWLAQAAGRQPDTDWAAVRSGAAALLGTAAAPAPQSAQSAERTRAVQ